MPLIQVDMFEGRTDEQVQAYCHALTDATCRLLGCTAADVTIVLRDVPRSRWSTGGVLWSDTVRGSAPAASIAAGDEADRRVP